MAPRWSEKVTRALSALWGLLLNKSTAKPDRAAETGDFLWELVLAGLLALRSYWQPSGRQPVRLDSFLLIWAFGFIGKVPAGSSLGGCWVEFPGCSGY